MTTRRRLTLIILGTALSAACDRTRDPPRPSPPIAIQLAVGESAYIHGALDSARAVWEDALVRSRAAADPVGESRSLTWLGLAARRRGDHAGARRLGEEALALKLRWHLNADLSKSYNALGLLAWDEGRLTDALDLYTRARAAALAAGDKKAITAVAGNLALVQTQFGEFEAARRGFLSARDGAREIRDARLEGNALNNLGMLAVWTGDPERAIDYIQQARARYRTIDYRAGELNAIGQLSTAYAAKGEYQLAIALLDSALAESRRLEQRDEEASTLELLARQHRESGDLPRALALFDESRRLNAALDQPVEVGNDLQSEAEIRATLGDLEAAARLATRALALHERAASHSDELGDRILLADLYSRSGNRREARTQVEAANRLAVHSQSRLARAQVAIVAARLLERTSDPPGVVRVLDSARADWARVDYGIRWQAELLLSRAFARLGHLDSAAAAGERAVAAVERGRGAYGSGLLRTSYLADKTEAYEQLAAVLLRQGRIDAAFAVSDAARGRGLIDHANSSSVDSAGVASGALLLRIDRLAATIDTVESSMDAHSDSAAQALLTDLYDRQTKLRSEYEAEFTHRGRADDGNGTALDVSALRSGLGNGEILLEYLVGADSLRIFAVSRATLRAYALPVSGAGLSARIRVARAALEGASTRNGGGGANTALYRELIEPVERAGELRGVHRLVIIPQGVLSYLPFAALQRSADDPALVESVTISYAPSAGALMAIRARNVRSGPLDAATIFAPLPDALPFSRSEASAVGALLPSARILLGPDATEAEVRRALARFGVVHVATHASMNRANPLFSGLSLAPGMAEHTEDDGRLEVHEIVTLSVRSPLVYLSGCETAFGPAGASAYSPREDYATLAEAFLYGGAQDVVATLWRVDDAGAARMASRFYVHLATHDPAEALALAQRDLIVEAGPHASREWAAYGLWGAGGARPGAKKSAVAAVQ